MSDWQTKERCGFSVITWNVGILNTAWVANRPPPDTPEDTQRIYYTQLAGSAIGEKGHTIAAVLTNIRFILDTCKPDVLLLQEFGLHEHGISPQQLEEAFGKKGYGLTKHYVLTVNAAYVALTWAKHRVLESKLQSIHSKHTWRTVQVLRILAADQEWVLINTHLVSGGKQVSVKAAYGSGGQICVNDHSLSESRRKECIQSICGLLAKYGLATSQAGPATRGGAQCWCLAAGDFNSTKKPGHCHPRHGVAGQCGQPRQDLHALEGP